MKTNNKAIQSCDETSSSMEIWIAISNSSIKVKFEQQAENLKYYSNKKEGIINDNLENHMKKT